MKSPLARLISDNEQDRAECLAWWKSASDDDKLRVWEAIQRRYADTAMEIMSRLAQLKFAEMVEAEQ